MEIWIDAQLSPSLALWINQSFDESNAQSMRALGLRDASDKEIFMKARQHKAVIVSKDADFLKLLNEYGPPPQIIWITAGNTSNAHMRIILTQHLATAINMIQNGERLVEIGGS
jgi:predicted nuclease of predicted toxin-antitoxin system